jgi:hypothetical protein
MDILLFSTPPPKMILTVIEMQIGADGLGIG